MKAPDRTTGRVRDWLRQSTPTPPDAERSVEDVMATLFRQSQVQPRVSARWFSGRGGNEGGSSMFTALKLGLATALVALVGGFFTVSVTQPAEDSAPGAAVSPSPSAEAETAAGPAVAVSGRVNPGRVAREADVEIRTTVPEEVWTDYVWVFQVVTDDPRINGRLDFTQNVYSFLADDLFSGSVQTAVGRIVNDGGSWAVEAQGFAQPGLNAYHNSNFVLHLTGSGGYDGLSAILLMDPVPRSHWDVEGIIFPGAPPETPASVDPPEA